MIHFILPHIRQLGGRVKLQFISLASNKQLIHRPISQLSSQSDETQQRLTGGRENNSYHTNTTCLICCIVLSHKYSPLLQRLLHQRWGHHLVDRTLQCFTRCVQRQAELCVSSEREPQAALNERMNNLQRYSVSDHQRLCGSW